MRFCTRHVLVALLASSLGGATACDTSSRGVPLPGAGPGVTTPTEPGGDQPTTPTTPSDPTTPWDDLGVDTPETPGHSAAWPAMTAVARAVLQAFAAQDLNQLAAAVPPDAALAMRTLSGPNRDALLGADGWRMAAVAAWDGSFGVVRRSGDRARVPFAVLDTARVAVVELTWDGGAWRLINVLQYPLARLNAWGEVVQ